MGDETERRPRAHVSFVASDGRGVDAEDAVVVVDEGAGATIVAQMDKEGAG